MIALRCIRCEGSRSSRQRLLCWICAPPLDRRRSTRLREITPLLPLRCIRCGGLRSSPRRLICWTCAPLSDSRHLNQLRRKAREASVIHDLTVEQWNAILRLYDYRCAYCGQKAGILQWEHVIPVMQGGDTTTSNIVPACWPCNKLKGQRTAEQFGNIPAKRLML